MDQGKTDLETSIYSGTSLQETDDVLTLTSVGVYIGTLQPCLGVCWYDVTTIGCNFLTTMFSLLCFSSACHLHYVFSVLFRIVSCVFFGFFYILLLLLQIVAMSLRRFL